MTRKEAREQAFILVFEKCFRKESVEEIIESALDDGMIEENDYARSAAIGVYDNLQEIDQKISDNLKGWTIGRLSKVSLAAMRLSVCEMLYLQDIPVGVSINEAVELTKKFATEEDAAYVNGVLGSVAKMAENA